MSDNFLEWRERKFLHVDSNLAKLDPKKLKEAMDITDALRFKLVAELARRIEKKREEEDDV